MRTPKLALAELKRAADSQWGATVNPSAAADVLRYVHDLTAERDALAVLDVARNLTDGKPTGTPLDGQAILRRVSPTYSALSYVAEVLAGDDLTKQERELMNTARNALRDLWMLQNVPADMARVLQDMVHDDTATAT